MREMSRAEWWEFATTGTRTGMLGVVRADGTAHVTPVWFLLAETPDGDELVFTTEESSLKGKAFRRDPRFTLCVDDQRPPFSFVQFRAEARLLGHDEHPDELLEWATAIGSRYMGEDAGPSYGKRNAVAGEYLVRAKITKVVARADIAG
ncbi:PPOX class F420-dependent oxidoreductase [Amycolatopsis sp. CA-230715]|uniref:PPOX class F420-dependent oxidoreductase n=1 Tax=Amycolatopsis sp. CA-230715 TaxID=2745196 RepID=UPI001C02BC49|nr:PPOX class F420-dependent oxidoreductase [Amycolatopsis sp. CA-230715]